MTVKARVRQRYSSLPSDWHDDPPQEVRALVQDLLYNALPFIVLLPHLIESLLYLHPRPKIETFAFQKPPTNRFLLQPSSLTGPLCLPDAHRPSLFCSSASSLYGDSSGQLLPGLVAASFSQLFAYIFLAA